MDLLPLLISFAAGGLVACLAIFWLVARTAPHINSDVIEHLQRETDETAPHVSLITRREDQMLH